MPRPRVLLLAALAAAAVVWAYTASSPGRSAAVRASRAAQAPRTGRPVFDLEVRLERLNGHEPIQPEPRRNPFRFGEDLRASRDPQPAQVLAPAAITTGVAAPAALPVLSLLGIVDRTVSGKAIRVAVLSTTDGLVYVSAGERVGARYEVAALSADAVELKDLTDGSVRRLVLK